MASQIKHPAAVASTQPTNIRATKVTNYVNQQLEKTQRQVKSNDLLGGLLTVIAIALGFLLVAAIWDAWIWPLTTSGRWICLGILISGCLLYATLAIMPLFIRKINPDYAAKMIEEAKPTFKNSLLNYVSLRKKTDVINPAVFDAVSRQAATDLSTVPADATVDRSRLIRLGFVLIGLMVFGVGYKMLSPKDPLQTFGRILAPSAKIAQPAVVRISDVEPGDASIFFGEPLEVTAVVRGRHEPSDVFLEYSTLDGQLINQRIPMSSAGVPGRYRGDLSVSGAGIQQSLIYRVVARDGVSPDFDLTVQANPTIAVESLVLTPPRYTKMPERTLNSQGNIEAIEGTQIVVHAVANLPIEKSYIELLQIVNDPFAEVGENSGQPRVVRTIEMASEGRSASGRFTALLNSARQKQLATHYRLTFISTDGDRNLKPNVYPIKIIPDLAPEIAITHPNVREVSVAENGTLAVDIEANDLDFEIASVEFQLDHGGARTLSKKLELKSTNDNQRVTARYLLKPTELRLQAGDRAIFYATASDNRTAPENGDLPDPNISRSENFTLTITEPEKQPANEKQDQSDSPSNSDPQTGSKDGGSKSDDPKTGDSKDGDESQNGESQSGESQSGESQSGESQSGESQSGESQSGESQSGESQSGESQSSESQSGESQSGESQSGESQSEGTQGNQTDSGTDNQSADGSDSKNSSAAEGQNSKGESGSNSDSTESPSKSGDPSNAGNEGGNEGGASSGGDDSNMNQGGSSASDSQSEKSNQPSAANSNQSNDGNSAGDSNTGNETNGSDGRGDQKSSENDDSTAGGDGRQDRNLTEGDRQPLDKNASTGEQVRRLQELLDEKDKQQGRENSSEQGAGEQASQEQNTQPKNGDGNSKTGEQPDAQQPKSDGDNASQSSGGDSAPDKTNSGDSKKGDDPKQGGSKSGENESAQESQNQSPTADPKGSESQSSESQSSESQSSESQSSDAKQGDGQSSKSQTGGSSESSDAKQGGSQQDQSNQQKSGSSESESGESESGESGKQQDGSKSGAGESESSAPDSGSTEPQDNGQKSSQSNSDSAAGQKGGEGSEPAQGGKPKSGNGQSTSGAPSNQASPESSDGKQTGGQGGGSGALPSHEIEKERENLEHSKKATDLILNRLNEQKYDPDPELLKEMNWTQEDLNQFLDRWNAMKNAANRGDQNAQRKYERSLKSLDLRPNADSRSVRQIDDQVDSLNQDNAVILPPADLAPDFNATLRDINR